MRSMSRLALLGALLFAIRPVKADPITYRIDPAASRMEVLVGRSGILAGLSHRVHVAVGSFQGTVVADRGRLKDATVALDVETGSLDIVCCDLDHDDRREAQRYLRGKRCLDVKEFPGITFRSNRVRVSPRPWNSYYLLVNGALDIHGSIRELEVPVTITYDDAGLKAKGQVSFRQSDHGIHPWKDLLGAIEVPDLITLEFDLRAVPVVTAK